MPLVLKELSKDVIFHPDYFLNEPRHVGIFTCVDSDEPVQPRVNLRNSKCYLVSSLQSSTILATSNGSDQPARMRRLVRAFGGRTYHIVGNLMSRLKYLAVWSKTDVIWSVYVGDVPF